jgi:hypothetical protein
MRKGSEGNHGSPGGDLHYKRHQTARLVLSWKQLQEDRKGRWCIGCKKYLKEAITRVEAMFGSLKKHANPSETGDHPEMDASKILGTEDHQKYHMLIGMLVWIVTIGRVDVAHVTSSLSRFTTCPRQGHIERALHVFDYLKKRPNQQIIVNSRDPMLRGGMEGLELDCTHEFKGQ